MDPKYKSFEKLLNTILVPKLNKVFYNYGELGLRIKNIKVKKSEVNLTGYVDYDDFKYDEIQIYVNYEETNKSNRFLLGDLSFSINHMILNLVSYVFTEEVIMQITVIKGNDTARVSHFDTNGQRISDQYAMDSLISELEEELNKREE